MEASRSSEPLVSCHNATWHCNPEDLNLNLHNCENLKLHENYQTLTWPETDMQSYVWEIMGWSFGRDKYVLEVTG
jgi:hypothetical protein